jgi:sec-independent protein translocase protein TatA
LLLYRTLDTPKMTGGGNMYPFALAGMFLGSIGVPEVAIILLIAIIVFGGKRLGDIGKGLGEGIRNFKVAVKDDKPSDQKGGGSQS